MRKLITGITFLSIGCIIRYSPIAKLITQLFGISSDSFNLYVITGMITLIFKLLFSGILQAMLDDFYVVGSNKAILHDIEKIKLDGTYYRNSDSEGEKSELPPKKRVKLTSPVGHKEKDPTPSSSSQNTQSTVVPTDDARTEPSEFTKRDGKYYINNPEGVKTFTNSDEDKLYSKRLLKAFNHYRNSGHVDGKWDVAKDDFLDQEAQKWLSSFSATKEEGTNFGTGYRESSLITPGLKKELKEYALDKPTRIRDQNELDAIERNRGLMGIARKIRDENDTYKEIIRDLDRCEESTAEMIIELQILERERIEKERIERERIEKEREKESEKD